MLYFWHSKNLSTNCSADTDADCDCGKLCKYLYIVSMTYSIVVVSIMGLHSFYIKIFMVMVVCGKEFCQKNKL